MMVLVGRRGLNDMIVIAVRRAGRWPKIQSATFSSDMDLFHVRWRQYHLCSVALRAVAAAAAAAATHWPYPQDVQFEFPLIFGCVFHSLMLVST
jgi:hypothetical protein